MTLTRNHIFGFIGLTLLAVLLYWAKSEAQAVREQVIVLQDKVEQERRAVRTLEAELAWLERPDRLEKVASSAMGLAPVTADRIGTERDIAAAAPLAPAGTTSAAVPPRNTKVQPVAGVTP